MEIFTQYTSHVSRLPGEQIIATLISRTSSSLCSATNIPICGSSRFPDQNPVWQYSIVKEFGELTRDELHTYSKEVEAAKTKELIGWQKLDALKCIPRAKGTNVVDARWVLRWKPDSTNPRGKTVKARLVVRGFKDTQGDTLDTFASIVTPWAQQIILSVAVQNDWHIRCLDVAQAFLQGIDFKTLAAQTGEPLRRVCFTPPSDSWQILSKLGYNCNPAAHVF